MNHLWTGIFITCGGVIGFSVNFLISMYVIIGIFLTVLFINGYMIRRTQLTQIVKELKEQGKQNGKYL